MAQQPVFYDPRQARWKRLRRIFDLAALAFTFLVIFFIYTALRSERLPDLLLPIQKRPYRALKEKEKEKAKEHRRLAALHRGHRKSKSAPSQVKLNAEEGIRAAFYVPWDAASFSSLREYARQIDLLFPTWLQVLTPDGRLQSVDEQTNKLFNVVQGVTVRSVDDKVMPFVKSEDTGMEVFPVVQNFDGTDWIDISAFLNDPDARARFRGQADAFLASDKFRGLMIDFEDFPQKAQPGYMALLSELSSDLHAKGLKLYVSVQARNADFDYTAVAALVDGVVVMNYDEHYPGAAPGPVASQDWFVRNLTAIKKVLPQEKVICAIGNYGYDWAQKHKHGPLPPGASDPNVSGQDVDMEGDGEILRIEARPTDGARAITIDSASGQITDESFESLPEPYRVGRYGSSKNQLAITFDDGPDPEWTPKILDVLKEKQAPATFFLIGIQADKFSDLTQRIYREGHEIGNHTFTHPDISNISHRFMQLELNLTERLFASRLGMRTILFRPPYSIDQEPDTEDQVRPLEITQDMGYTTVGNKIDPSDWRENPHRSAEQISADVLAHLPPCAPNDQRCGNIILLHDGGGDRRETVRALPMIIDGIRARGYQIVPVYQLLGKTRADVMPPLPANERWAARLNFVGFWLFDFSIKAITWIFLIGDVLMTGRLLIIGAFAIYDRLRARQYGRDADSYKPDVAVLIPAYNEEKVIERTVRAALASDYPNLRVIVIDDGSKDKTLEVAQAAFAREEMTGQVLILTKPNSGKADALNFGLEHLRDEEIFVGIDADTMIARDAISRLVPHFLDPQVGAVAGNAKVGNRVNLWTRWQALEYITSQNFERRALNTLGAVSVVPGAIGAWRTSAVREAGAYHTDTVAEDADLTMALLERGYRVEYEDRALAYTEAPVNANGLMRQRFRWSFGILQSVWKHRSAFGRKGVLGWIALPNILIFQILLPLVSPFIDLMFSVGTVWYFIQKFYHPESTDPASFQRLVLFFAAFLVIDFLASAIAFALERREAEGREDIWLLSQVWLQRFAYRQLFSVVLLKTLKRAIEGQRFAWDKLERTAKMSYRPAEQRESVKVP